VAVLSTLLRGPPASVPTTLHGRPCGAATSPLPPVYPLRELTRMVLLRVSWSRPIHFPAALCSTGRYPALLRGSGLSGVGFPTACLHSYGGSDFRPVPLSRVPARAALIRCAHPSRGSPPGTLSPLRSGSTLPHDIFPAFSPQPSATARFSLVDEGCKGKRLPLMRQASPFPSRLAAVVNRIGFTRIWDRRSASGCSPRRLATTQLPSAALP
jgi:hypothetical protein